jgi:hypothetical protein
MAAMLIGPAKNKTNKTRLTCVKILLEFYFGLKDKQFAQRNSSQPHELFLPCIS